MQCDTGPTPDTGNDFDRALVQLSDAQDQGQSQTGPIGRATLLQTTEESVECAALAFIGEAGAVIANRDRHAILVVCDIDRNARAREAQRIIEQVS
jgi:hypothetical protein